MSIGQFAKLTHLSVKALRHYHETHVLAPAYVDPDTGYRQYEHSQAHRAHLVRRLRAADMSLPDIADLLGDADDRRERVAAHADELARRAAELADAAAALRSSLDAEVATLDIIRQELTAGPALVVTETCGLDDVDHVCADAFERLDSAAASIECEIFGPGAASFADGVFESTGTMTCALPISEHPATQLPAGVTLGLTPSGIYLTAVHTGDRGELGVTYSALGAHVDELGVAADLPVVERYVVHRGETADLRTEVCWPVIT